MKIIYPLDKTLLVIIASSYSCIAVPLLLLSFQEQIFSGDIIAAYLATVMTFYPIAFLSLILLIFGSSALMIFSTEKCYIRILGIVCLILDVPLLAIYFLL